MRKATIRNGKGEARAAPGTAAGYRDALLAAVGPSDVGDIVRALVERAKTGDPIAARLVLDRLCGTKTVPDWEWERNPLQPWP